MHSGSHLPPPYRAISYPLLSDSKMSPQILISYDSNLMKWPFSSRSKYLSHGIIFNGWCQCRDSSLFLGETNWRFSGSTVVPS